MLHEIITSPLYIFLKELLPDGFDKQVVNFAGAYFLIRFTLMAHLKIMENKLDTLNKNVKEGFASSSKEIGEIKLRVTVLETIKSQGGLNEEGS